MDSLSFIPYFFYNLLMATLACAGSPDPVEHLRDGNPAPLLQGGQQLDQHQPPYPASIQGQDPEPALSTLLIMLVVKLRVVIKL